MPVVKAGPSETTCEVPRVPLALVQNEAEASRTPAQDLFPFLDGMTFEDGTPRWKLRVDRGPVTADALVLGYNAIHLSGDVKDALNTEPPTGPLVVLHQLKTDCLQFLQDRLAIELRAMPGRGPETIGVPAERHPQYEPLLNWPRPVNVGGAGFSDVRTLRWLSFRPGSAWRVVLEARSGSRRFPVVVRTSDLESQRIVVCTLLLEARVESHARLLENMVTYAATGWPEVAVVEGGGPTTASYDAALLVDRLRVEGSRAISVQAAVEPLPLYEWPLAGVQRVVIPGGSPFEEATAGPGGEEWVRRGGALVQVDATGITVRAGTPDAQWVGRRWSAWFSATDAQHWLGSIFSTRSVVGAFATVKTALGDAADDAGLGGTIEPYHRRIAALLARRVRWGNVDETIGVTAAALDLNRLCGGHALADDTLVRRWLGQRFDDASPEDRLDIARSLCDGKRLTEALEEATPDNVSAIWAIRVRQALAAVHAKAPGTGLQITDRAQLARIDDDRVRRELATSPLLAAELLSAVREIHAIDPAHPLATLSPETWRTAIDGLIELQALTRGDLAAADAHAVSLEATAILAWLELFPGAAFQVSPRSRELPVKVVESVLREVRRAREGEEDARVDLPALGSVVHVLAPLALVAAAVALAAVLRIFEVSIGTRASWWAAGAVAVAGLGLALVRFGALKNFGPRRDLRFAQSVVGVLVLMLTVAIAAVIFRTLDSLVAALAVLTIAVALMAAFVVLVLDRLRLSPPWMADVLSFVGDPRTLVEWARTRASGDRRS